MVYFAPTLTIVPYIPWGRLEGKVAYTLSKHFSCIHFDTKYPQYTQKGERIHPLHTFYEMGEFDPPFY